MFVFKALTTSNQTCFHWMVAPKSRACSTNRKISSQVTISLTVQSNLKNFQVSSQSVHDRTLHQRLCRQCLPNTNSWFQKIKKSMLYVVGLPRGATSSFQEKASNVSSKSFSIGPWNFIKKKHAWQTWMSTMNAKTKGLPPNSWLAVRTWPFPLHETFPSGPLRRFVKLSPWKFRIVPGGMVPAQATIRFSNSWSLLHNHCLLGVDW